MKNLLLAVAGTLCMVSCNNEVDTVLSLDEISIQTKALVEDLDYQVVNYAGTQCFQFKNDSIFSDLVLKVAGMSDEKKSYFFSNFDFVSQQDLMEEADREQEAIVDSYENSLEPVWPYQQIKSFKQKYEDVFMFNPYDSTDFIANYKVKNTIYRCFVNRQGIFLIGDSVVQCPTYGIEEFFGSSIVTCGDNEATNESSRSNNAESKYQIPGGDYVKVRAIWNFAEQTISNKNFQYIDIDYLSQKKKVLWKKHHATVHLRFKATASGEGIEVYNEAYSRFENQNNANVMLYTEVYDKKNVNLGRFGETAKPSGPVVGPFTRYSLDGRMEIWSNEIPETNKGTSKLYFLKNW